MKKLALINLIVLIAIKSISACEFPHGKEPVSVFDGREIYFWAMFIGSFLLFVPVVALYYLRKRRGLATILLSIITLLVFIPALIAASFINGMCSDGALIAAVILGDFFVMSLLFTIQLSSWISERKTNLKLR